MMILSDAAAADNDLDKRPNNPVPRFAGCEAAPERRTDNMPMCSEVNEWIKGNQRAENHTFFPTSP